MKAAMIGTGTPALLGALVCFVVFFANVALGAAGLQVLLGDVAEMLTLFASAILFVVGVLAREAAESGLHEQQGPQDNQQDISGRNIP